MVVRYFRPGRVPFVEILYSDGRVAQLPSMDSAHFIVTCPDGTRRVEKRYLDSRDMEDISALDPIASRCSWDVLTGAQVQHAANGVLVVSLNERN